MYNNEDLTKTLKKGGIAVMPTDTVYGIVGRAENKDTVDRIYQIRKRNPDKPCIILIGNLTELEKFSVNLTGVQKDKLKEFWPGPVSVVLDCINNGFEYLHRGTDTLAFRLPELEELRNFLTETGPLVAPSANPEGEPTAKNTEEAKKYFGDLVDFYLDAGEIQGNPSKIIKLSKDGLVTVLRD